jgi:hypothetical protein
MDQLDGMTIFYGRMTSVMTNFSPENGLGVPEFDQMFAQNDLWDN